MLCFTTLHTSPNLYSNKVAPEFPLLILRISSLMEITITTDNSSGQNEKASILGFCNTSKEISVASMTDGPTSSGLFQTSKEGEVADLEGGRSGDGVSGNRSAAKEKPAIKSPHSNRLLTILNLVSEYNYQATGSNGRRRRR
ncbi:unnamed protein product [Lactuca saligna]|uniref:Uncharacterized protein n=1 Tax=Lactuca saligna TaxID=75948 RepID=A0AA35ZCU3_LACSI|nr:unnamed protein product [Lactuca saligna]